MSVRRFFCTRTMSTVKKVFVSRKIPQPAVDLLHTSRTAAADGLNLEIDFWDEDEQPPRTELLHRVRGTHAIYCSLTEKIDAELLNAAGPQLEVVSTMSVGFDHIDVKACNERSISVGNTPGVLTDATADLTVALLLATARRLPEGIEAVKSGTWGAWSPFWMLGSEIRGSTVGMVGLGRIGMGVARRLLPFGVERILYCGRSEKAEAVEVLGEFLPFKVLLKESDFVIVCCALNDDTREIFDYAAFSRMKRSAIFVNTSRGGVVNQEGLHKALQEGLIRAAGLDVTTPEPLSPDHPLNHLSNCIVLPHIGSSEVKTREDMATLAARNLLAGLQQKPMPSQVKL
eukprot:m.32225 g.32225  ORF g.32225 m.32225 type:complete len:344 (+) comp31606_c0_seq1:45-1076(+)